MHESRRVKGTSCRRRLAPESLEQIRQLRHLQKLVVKHAEVDGLNGLPHIRSESIIELEFGATNFDIAQVAENLPNLRQLVLNGHDGASLDVSLCLQSFNHMEELWLTSIGIQQRLQDLSEGEEVYHRIP